MSLCDLVRSFLDCEPYKYYNPSISVNPYEMPAMLSKTLVLTNVTSTFVSLIPGKTGVRIHLKAWDVWVEADNAGHMLHQLQAVQGGETVVVWSYFTNQAANTDYGASGTLDILTDPGSSVLYRTYDMASLGGEFTSNNFSVHYNEV